MKLKKKNLAGNIMSLVLAFLLMASAAIVRDGRFMGHDLSAGSNEDSAKTVAITTNSDGTVTISTVGAEVGVIGYSGPVPVEITVDNGRVAEVRPAENTETPVFFNKVTESGLLSAWNGLTPDEALTTEVDAVTGATYSSDALIANVRAGLKDFAKSSAAPDPSGAGRGAAYYAALLVLLTGAIMPFFIKDKRYRLLQEILNVGVLGFWAGTFVDYTLVLGVMSNGLGTSATLITVLMMFVAFIYPLFNKPGHYCAWICPLGSLQELASRCNPRHKLQVGQRVGTILTRFRMGLWMALMICLWTGFFASWIDYELFTSFIVESASIGVLIAGGVFVILSFFVSRPYCRYVCPTGTLLRMSQDMDNK